MLLRAQRPLRLPLSLPAQRLLQLQLQLQLQLPLQLPLPLPLPLQLQLQLGSPSMATRRWCRNRIKKRPLSEILWFYSSFF